MIQYSLKCAEGHSFDSWFQSAAAFDKLAAAGMVSCAICGSQKVEKAIMAPHVRPGRKSVSPSTDPDTAAASAQAGGASPQASVPAQVPEGAPGALSAPASEQEKALRELRRQVEENSDYVGKDFVSEARAMHLGDAPERAIHGEARLDEAKALIEDGVPVLPLPFGPTRKTN
ncbi:DUF1178 family protein [Phaeobacter gallaeciensis]|uniref:DUF1178 family protein n=1 Tax=Phaeobacter TaxID=302485 RepID=UPI00237F4939|nr:DUF1178 family protein [Phaeobacter gallaeciensis]MDE4302468.1 DUF1178 family protein [Phaeobacter gallaeciensis]MDE4306554.1 DUF1178 family protein [Phaeobacter gallaeciensis]MDE4311327.1 DUF1178 family protein [Phaeobacter gallaeciensis]MDE4315790.1 DUF1178 family protein [Phaeobacter gallaeciensis]MDE4320254.1 DUF1178 family protein [Phaeobacter gallaeciensis]